jgi:hypothetical protein
MIYWIAGEISVYEQVEGEGIRTHQELEWLKIADFTDVEFSRVAVDVQHETAILGSRVVPGIFGHRMCSQPVAW